MHIIDSGNTNLKLAQVDQFGAIKKKFVFQNSNELYEHLKSNNIEEAYCCSVNLELNFSGITIHNLNTIKDKLDFNSVYSKELGNDRLAICYYLQKFYPKKKVAVINAGSFTTVDYIDHEKHLGGYIFLGQRNYLNAYENGKLLPFLSESELNLDNLNIPQNTNEAILGSLNFINHGIVKKITDENYDIIVTGGNAKNFLINDTISHDQDLLFKSLFQIFSAFKSTFRN